jgi:hypothetical protein
VGVDLSAFAVGGAQQIAQPVCKAPHIGHSEARRFVPQVAIAVVGLLSADVAHTPVD